MTVSAPPPDPEEDSDVKRRIELAATLEGNNQRSELIRVTRELTASNRVLALDVTKVGEKLTIQQRETRKLRRTVWSLVTIIVILFAVIGGLGVVEHQEKSFTNCVEQWANRSTTRAELITKYNSIKLKAEQARSDALDPIVRRVTHGQFGLGDIAKYGPAYEKASDAYNKALARYREETKANPVPKAPELTCK